MGYSHRRSFRGGNAPQTLDHGQYFLQNGISTRQLLYTVVRNRLIFYYLHYPLGTLEDRIY